MSAGHKSCDLFIALHIKRELKRTVVAKVGTIGVTILWTAPSLVSDIKPFDLMSIKVLINYQLIDI